MVLDQVRKFKNRVCPFELAGIIRTGGKINFFAAFIAFMGFFKFIRENFFDCVTFGTIAGKGLQVFKLFKAWAVSWGGHNNLLVMCKC